MIGSGRFTQRYVGIDRRQPRERYRDALSRWELLWCLVAVVALVGVIPALAHRFVDAETPDHLVAAFRVASSAAFFGAALICLARWRLTGEARKARAGAGLIVLGLVVTPLDLFIGAHDGGPVVLEALVCRAIAVGCCLALLGSALVSPGVDSSIRPVRAIAIALAGTWAMIAGVALAARATAPVVVHSAWWVGLELALASGWVACAGRATRLAARMQDASLTRVGLALAVMALAELMMASAPDPGELAASGLQALAAALLAANAMADLGEVFAASGNRLLSVATALEQARHLLVERDELAEEQAHDARSAIAALRMAASTLERYGDRLDDETRQSLRRAISEELARLEHLIAPAPAEPTGFLLDEALHPVIVAQREAGLVVHADIEPQQAFGNAHDVATVVHTLLDNARRYAAGTDAFVWTEREVGLVRIHVEDAGPGVLPGERTAIFGRHFRGSASAGQQGSGLGLYVARRLMVAQGGDIHVDDGAMGGARFTVTLPASSARQSTSISSQIQVMIPAQRKPVGHTGQRVSDRRDAQRRLSPRPDRRGP